MTSCFEIVFPFFLKVIRGAAWLHTQGLGFGCRIAESFPNTARLFSGEAERKLFHLLSQTEQTHDSAYPTGDEDNKQNVTIP